MKFYVVGAGAHGQVVADVWRDSAAGAWIGFLDDAPALRGKRFVDIEVVGGLDTLDAPDPDARFVVAMGRNALRRTIAERLRRAGNVAFNAIHRSAVVLPSARLEDGIVVFPHGHVGANAFVGRDVILNTGVSIEHDCEIGAGASLSPGCTMGGRVRIGAGAFLATGVVVSPRVTIGEGAVVGVGSVVVKDVPPRTLAYGCPAKVVRDVGPDFDWSRLM